jgi:hypothetical protein
MQAGTAADDPCRAKKARHGVPANGTVNANDSLMKGLPMQAPDELRIYHGMLGLSASSRSEFFTSQEYLQDWMQQHNIPNGEPVCVIQRKEMQRLFDEITYLRSLIQCA